MKLQTTAFCLCALIPHLVLAACPEVSFQWEGGFSTYQKISVEIDASGKVRASVTRQHAKPKAYVATLNEYEIGCLDRIVRRVDLDSLPTFQSTPVPTDTGTSVLAVCIRSVQHQLTYQYQPRLRSLEQFLWNIATQADLNDVPQGKERMYELLGAIDPRHVASKVLQPYVFRQPLAESLKEQTDFQQISWRLQALSSITTPIEFAGIVSPCLNHADIKNWRFWLTTLSTPECYKNLHREHLIALFPLFEDEIRKYGNDAKTLETPEGEAFYRFKKMMREHNYETDANQNAEPSAPANGAPRRR